MAVKDMRAIAAAVAVAAAVVGSTPSAAAAQQGAHSPSAADEAAIGALLEGWQAAWNTHDMAAFARLFHDDGVWILWTGGVWTGRAPIEQGMTRVHRTVYRESTQLMRVDDVRFVAPDVAVVRGTTTLTGDARAPGQTIRGRKLLVLTRRGGAWRIAYGQNTRLADSVAD